MPAFLAGVKKDPFSFRREVKLGRRAEGYYEVLGGLAEGDSVVASGTFMVDSESRLKAAAESAPTPGAKQ